MPAVPGLPVPEQWEGYLETLPQGSRDYIMSEMQRPQRPQQQQQQQQRMQKKKIRLETLYIVNLHVLSVIQCYRTSHARNL
eukprot:3075428-Amphidinium_carterae.1